MRNNVLGLFVLVVSCASLSQALAADEEVHLQLLGINDYHGHVKTDAVGFGDTRGGGEYLSAKLTELRQHHKNSFTVAAGDLIGGTPAFSGLFHDEPSVESLNVMQLDISSVGNHEFDEGIVELLRMQNGGCHPVDGCYFPEAPFGGASFKWLAANVVSDADGSATPLPAYWIKQVDGVKVAFIGMTLEATDTLVAAAGVKGWRFLDEAKTANSLVPILRDQGAHAIVVLLHEGGMQHPMPGDINACKGFSGPIKAIHDALDPAIDVLITGHTHMPYNCRFKDAAGNERIVTSAYSYGRVVSEINLVLNKATGDVVREKSSATNHAVVRADLAADPKVTAVIEKWQPKYEELANNKIGEITADINRGGLPTGSDRGVESSAANLIADAQLWATHKLGAQIAFVNSGSVRTDLVYASSEAGEGRGVVTFGEAYSFQPFNNTLFTMEMTGEQIVNVLKEQCQPVSSSRPFQHLGVSVGFSYDLKTTLEDGKCREISISNIRLHGAALDDEAIYKVTVNNFLADGGDNFTTFTATTAPRLDGGIDLDALTSYLGAHSPVSPPGTNRVNELH